MAERRLEVDIIANDRASRPIKNLQSTIIRFVGAVSASLAALSAVVFPIQSAKEFDRVLRDIQKTTGFTNEEIKVLSGELLTLSKTVDTSANDLGRIAAAAGQLGLGEEGGQAILTFTESIARASTTLDLTAERAATSFAKIASIFNIPITQTENLTSTINELSNTTTATADQLLDVVSRVGTVAGSFEDAAALAAQAIQLGLSPETAGTSIVKIFSNFESRADQFAEEFGITVGDFLGKGAVERWKFYLNELGKLSEDEAARVINKLSGSGRIFALVDKQVQDAANGYAIFDQAQRNAEQAFIEGTSAIEEYANVSQSLEVQLGILRNNFVAIGTTIGLRVVPRLIEVTQKLIEFLQGARAQAFFDEISKGFNLLVSGLEGLVDILTTLGGGSLANVFKILFGGAIIKIGIAFVRFLDGVIAKLLSLGAAARSTTTITLGERIFKSLIPALTTLDSKLRESKKAFDVTQSELQQTSTAYDKAGASALRYANATRTAAVQQLGIAKTAQQASRTLADDRGARAFSPVPGQGAAQLRVQTIQQELVLQEKRRQTAIGAAEAAKKEAIELTRRLAVIKQADATERARFGAVSAGSKILQDQLNAQIRAQQTILRQSQERAVRLTSSTFQLKQQLVTWKSILATRQQAALVSIAGAGGAVQLSRTQKVVQGLSTSFARTGAAARTAGRAVFNFGNVLRIIGPIAAGLVTGIRTIIGLLGGPLTIAITAAIFFWDEISGAIRGVAEALGFVSEQDALLTEQLTKEAARQQAVIDRRIADWKRLEAAIEGGTQIQTDPAQTDPIGEESFAETGRAVGEAAERVRLYGGAVRGAAEQIAALEEQQNRIIERLARTKEAIDEANEAGEDTRGLTARYRELRETWDELDAAIDKVNETTDQASSGLVSAGDELAESFTTGLKSVLDTRLELVRASEAIASIEQDIKDLEDLKVSPQILTEASDDELRGLKQQLFQIFGERIDLDLEGTALFSEILAVGDQLNRELEDAEENAKELTQANKEAIAALTPSEAGLLAQTKILQANEEQLGALQDVVEGSDTVLETETDRARFLRANAKEILAQNFAYEAQLEVLEDQEDALEANRKAAQGIFDNTTREAQALVRALSDINRGIDDVLDSRVQQRNVDRNIATINQNIEDRTARIAELEETIAGTTDAYVRNKARAEIAELNALRTLDKSARRQAERRSAQIRLNQLASRQAELFREIQAAAAAGQTANFQALKGQLDQSIKESGGIVADLAGLQDEEGNFLFREDEIQSLQFALNQAARQYTDAIPNLNKDLLEAAETQEQALANTIKEFTTANKDLVLQYQELIGEFPEIAENIDLARTAWEKANEPLIDAINNFGSTIQTQLIQGQGLGEGFGEEFADLQQQALRSVDLGRAIDDDQFTRIVENGLDGVDTQAWIDKMNEAAKEGTEGGVNAITVNDLGEYTQAVRQATEDGLDQALTAIAAQREATGVESVQGAGGQSAEDRAAAARAAADAVKLPEAPVLTGLTSDPDALTQQKVKDAFTASLKDAQLGKYAPQVTDPDPLPERANRGTRKIRRADGGSITGPGTSTSDSIPAWLSNGEYVTDAKTVSALGGPGFFDSLKRIARSRGSTLRKYKGDTPAFAGGGLVGIPQGTSGGLAGLSGQSQLSPVNLYVGGSGPFPMKADPTTVTKIMNVFGREARKRGRR